MKLAIALLTLATASAFTTTSPFVSKGVAFGAKASSTFLNVAT